MDSYLEIQSRKRGIATSCLKGHLRRGLLIAISGFRLRLRWRLRRREHKSDSQRSFIMIYTSSKLSLNSNVQGLYLNHSTMHRIGDACLINPEKASGGLPFVSSRQCIFMQASMYPLHGNPIVCCHPCNAFNFIWVDDGRLAKSWRSTNKLGRRKMKFC